MLVPGTLSLPPPQHHPAPNPAQKGPVSRQSFPPNFRHPRRQPRRHCPQVWGGHGTADRHVGDPQVLAGAGPAPGVPPLSIWQLHPQGVQLPIPLAGGEALVPQSPHQPGRERKSPQTDRENLPGKRVLASMSYGLLGTLLLLLPGMCSLQKYPNPGGIC